MFSYETAIPQFYITRFSPAWLVLAGVGLFCILVGMISATLFLIGLLLLITALTFYNDAPRHIPQGEKVILAPLDGCILHITPNMGLPLTFDQTKDQSEHFSRIDLAQSLIGPRILRAPLSGRIKEILRDKADDTPDSKKIWSRMDGISLLIETPEGEEYAIVISGALIPRQIHLNIKVGDEIVAGKRLGLALFYATAELYVHDTAALLRTAGHGVRAGETILQSPLSQEAPVFRLD